LARRCGSLDRRQELHEVEALFHVGGMSSYDGTLLLLGFLGSLLKDVQPDEVPAKPKLVRIKLDELSQQGLGLLQILRLFKHFQLEELHSKVIRARDGIAVKDLQCALRIPARQSFGGENDHGAVVPRIDRERRLRLANGPAGVIELEK